MPLTLMQGPIKKIKRLDEMFEHNLYSPYALQVGSY